MRTRSQVAVLGAQIACQVACEKLEQRQFTDPSWVPPSTDALTNEWLTSVLCNAVPGARVVDHEVGTLDDGTNARRSLVLSYNEVGREAGLAECLFTKSTPTLRTRFIGAAGSMGLVETSFYRYVRPFLKIEAPEALYTGYDRKSHRLMLITDDVTATRGATFGTAVDRRLSRAQAEDIVDTFAYLHGTFWGAPLKQEYGGWLLGADEKLSQFAAVMRMEAQIERGFSRASGVVPASVAAQRKLLWPSVIRSQQLSVRCEPQTFLHGDVHPGNWYVTDRGRMGLYDWSTCIRGGPSRDLAYALSMHLPTADRRAWEEPLLGRYLDQLHHLGVEGIPSLEELFVAYRRQMCFALFAWIITFGRSRLQPKYQLDEICLRNIQRSSQALEDLDALSAALAAP